MKPSVCAVGTFNALDSPRFGFRGSGFFVGNGSLVATCWHVLPDAKAEPRPGVTSLAVLVATADGATEVREAELVASQRAHDLAVLRIKGLPGTPVNLAAASAPREGMEVALMGFPIGGVLGFRPVTHRGIVASIVASALPTQSSRQLNEGAVARLREGSFEPVPVDEARDAVVDRGLRREAGPVGQCLDVGVGGRHVARLHRQHVLLRRLAQRLLDGADEVHQLTGLWLPMLNTR
jgi:serine protease Do